MFTVIEIKELIRTGRVDKFYNDKFWRRLSKDVRREQNNECQLCKAKGIYTPSTITHHVNHLRKRPDLAYSRYYIDRDGKKKRQLIGVCDACHEAEHPDRHNNVAKPRFTNVERW